MQDRPTEEKELALNGRSSSFCFVRPHSGIMVGRSCGCWPNEEAFLAYVEVDVTSCFVCNVGAKVATCNSSLERRRVVTYRLYSANYFCILFRMTSSCTLQCPDSNLVKLGTWTYLFMEHCVQRLTCFKNGEVLHLFIHVFEFYHCFSKTHINLNYNLYAG